MKQRYFILILLPVFLAGCAKTVTEAETVNPDTQVNQVQGQGLHLRQQLRHLIV